jgi:hypothetical protein
MGGIRFEGGMRYDTNDDGSITVDGVKLDPVTLQPMGTEIVDFTIPKPEGYDSSFDVFSEPEDIHLLTCEKCGRVCKSVAGLAGHMRSHKEA